MFKSGLHLSSLPKPRVQVAQHGATWNVVCLTGCGGKLSVGMAEANSRWARSSFHHDNFLQLFLFIRLVSVLVRCGETGRDPEEKVQLKGLDK